MTEEEVAVSIAEQRKEIGSLKHRMEDVENMTQSINELAISVRELTLGMKQMLDRQEEQDNRLLKIEQEPADNWRQLKRMVLTAAVSGIVGAAVGAIIAML